MKCIRKGASLLVIREPGDRRVQTESQLLYHVKQELNKDGLDLIKKRMWKDGHLVDEMQQYLRSRKHKIDSAICVYDLNCNTRNSAESYNRNGAIVLACESLS